MYDTLDGVLGGGTKFPEAAACIAPMVMYMLYMYVDAALAI